MNFNFYRPRRLMIAVSGMVVFSVISVLVFGVVYAQDGGADHKPHWGYEGDVGPENWGKLDEAWSICSEGQAQSPINLEHALALNLINIELEYAPSALNIFNNGHTIQVNYDEGSSLIYNEIPFALIQFHMHHPSEHVVNGQPAAMELHLVHRDTLGNLAVIGVMIVEGEEDNPAYEVIFDNLPTEEGEPQPTDLIINAIDLLPQTLTYYTYIGSLTTPPCSQGVRWLVLTEPVSLSAEQIEAFAAIFEHNARPVQKLNTRDLLQDNS